MFKLKFLWYKLYPIKLLMKKKKVYETHRKEPELFAEVTDASIREVKQGND